MTVALRRHLALAFAALGTCAVALALAVPACGTGGAEGNGGMVGLPGSGLGPYRRLDAEEASGRLGVRRMALVESGMVLRGAGALQLVFYAAADLPPPVVVDGGMPSDGGPDVDAAASDGGALDAGALDAGIEDAGMADAGGADASASDAGPAEPDLSAFLPRRILRSNFGNGPSYSGGTVVLEASETWEGDAVFDPWAIVLASGRVRLYYAAAGGIGIAESDAADGTFTRVGSAPVLAGLRRPTVTPRPDGAAGFFLYAEDAGTIVVASSADGLTFDAPVPVDLGFPPSDAGVPQIAVGSPGAGLQIPQLDPPRIILFFESRRSDGSRTLGIAASLDGLNFERATLPAFGPGLREGFPAPDLVDAHTTLLYFTIAAPTEGRPSRALTVSVSPGTLRFD